MPVALDPVPATVPLVVVAHDDPGTADALRHAVETAAGFRVAVAQPGPSGLAAALATGPTVALVGCALLAELPASTPDANGAGEPLPTGAQVASLEQV
jgi:hypothetical protein